MLDNHKAEILLEKYMVEKRKHIPSRFQEMIDKINAAEHFLTLISRDENEEVAEIYEDEISALLTS